MTCTLIKNPMMMMMTYVREVTETDFCNYMCLYIQFDSIVYFLSLFELVSLLSKQFNALKVYVWLQHVFSSGVTLTRCRCGLHILPTLYRNKMLMPARPTACLLTFIILITRVFHLKTWYWKTWLRFCWRLRPFSPRFPHKISSNPSSNKANF